MFCRNCGTEISENAKFCKNCGFEIHIEKAELSEKIIKTNTGINNKSLNIIRIALLMVAIIFGISMCNGNKNLSEYTNNSGDKLDIVVIDISKGFNDYWTEIYATVKNVSDKDYKTAKFALMAWDDDGYPLDMKLGGLLNQDDRDYVGYINASNLKVGKAIEIYEIFDIDVNEIKNITLFLVETEDFNNHKWISPIVDELDEIKGKKLTDIDIYGWSFE